MTEPKSAPNLDEKSIREAELLATRSLDAQKRLAELNQNQVDVIVSAVAEAGESNAEALASAAVDETGFGVLEDKIEKNLFASRRVHEFIRPMKTVGVISRDESRGVIEIAEPFGVVAGIIPSTNPTSTTIYKALIAIKARCSIVFSPHPSAVQCISKTANLIARAAESAGAPKGSISSLSNVTLEGTQALMRRREVAVILATGGLALVREAYSTGKPAYGVGPGNAPAYIEGSADIRQAVRDIIKGKTFDNGLLCSSENSVVVDSSISEEVRREFQSKGAYFLSEPEQKLLSRALVTPQRLPNPEYVGKSALEIAQRSGIDVPPDTTVLLASLRGVGREHPLSMEKLCPVLSFYEVSDWRAGCERCKEILRYGGMGHTMAIHSRNDEIVLQFGLKKPAFRIIVNSPTTHGSIGLTTGLDPAMTLGCGGFGGNITSDNITPKHLINVKRIAYGLTSASSEQRQSFSQSIPLPQTPLRTSQRKIPASAILERIDESIAAKDGASNQTVTRPPLPSQQLPSVPADFVCEDDVKKAIRDEKKILINERTIITPAARDLALTHQTFHEEGLTRY